MNNVTSLRQQFSGRDYVREKVRIRDNHTCQDCGRKWTQGERRLDVHHIINECGYNSRGYDRVADMDGLITLCHDCHFNAHDFNGRPGAPVLKPGTTNMVKYRGRTRSVSEWCQLFGLDYKTVVLRIKQGRSAHDAFFGSNAARKRAA